MSRYTCDIVTLEGCAVRQRMNCCSEFDAPWDEIKKDFKDMCRPYKMLTIRYRDSDGDMVTIVGVDDFREALKEARSRSGNKISLFFDVEKQADVEPTTPSTSVSMSDMSVSTMVSSLAEPLDIASLKKDIVDSVLTELRKEHSAKFGKSGKSGKLDIQCCACESLIQSQEAVFFKCANCKSYFLCEQCERSDNYSHEANHVFLKLRHPLKRLYTNKTLLKNVIVVSNSREEQPTDESGKERSVSTSADLMGFYDVMPSLEVKPSVRPQSKVVPEPESDSIEPRSSEPVQTTTEKVELSRVRSVSTSTCSSFVNREDAEDVDDFYVVPLPPCFDLDVPLDVRASVRIDGRELSSQPRAETEEKSSQASFKVESAEAAIQHDLDCLAQSMSVINTTEPPRELQPEPVPIPAPSVPEPVSERPTPIPTLIPSAVPFSPSAILQQVASVWDSTPASISLTPRSPMDQLIEMGFGNRRLNSQLLEKYHGSVEQVVADLLALEHAEFVSWY